ncbi:MAG: hypothetical protein H7282_16375 [Cytophagaceae bacterium]|nr:hypothetical protein [Cytophagaceae bacterium]
MKHFVTTLFTLTFVLAFTLGCKKSSNDEPAPDNSTTTLQNRIEKKWDVSTPPAGRVAAGSEAYTSFEFTDEGKYFIIKADKSQLKGSFTLTVGDSILTLDGLGKIYIDDITETQIIFRLVLTGTTDEINVNAAPATPISISQNTKKLLNSWSYKSRKVNGTPDATINDAFSSGNYYLYATFTNYGTYSIETNAPGTASKVGIWKWCNTEQTSFGTSNDPDVQPTCVGMNASSVSFNSDGNLVLTATINGNVQEDTYVTKP